MQARPIQTATATLFLLAPLATQTWRDTSQPGPAARYDHAMAWDSARGHGVLFGGYDYGSDRYFDDTWVYDGASWAQTTLGGAAPLARKQHAMCYDARRGVVVLFGGVVSNAFNSNTRYLGDTWEFDGASWREVIIAGPTPDPRVTDIAYDTARGVVVLVGGANATSFHRDIWEYDGVAWTERGTDLLPRSRPGYELAYDVARGVTVIEPRYQYGQFGPWETQEWDGATLSRAAYTDTGPHFPGGDLAYDARRGVVVAVGTWFTGATETWEYDGNDWRQLAATTGQDSLANHSLVYADTLGSLVLFGGEKASGPFLVETDETFEFAEFAKVSAFGAGCGTGSIAPDLQPASGSVPRTGTRFGLAVTGTPANGTALLLVGLHRDRWAGRPLPFDLSSLGLPGCQLSTSIELVHGVATDGAAALDLPAEPALHGVALHLQALVHDPSLRPVGISGGLTATLGR